MATDGYPHWASNVPLLISGAAVSSVEITTPADSSVVSNGQLTVNWVWFPASLSSVAYKLVIYDSLSATIYDTGIVTFANQNTHTVPAGILETGESYAVEVTAYFADGSQGSDTNNFTTSFDTSTVPGNVRAFPVGDKCQAYGPDVLPHIRVEWDQANLGLGEVFSAYRVWRREYGQPWVCIASLTDGIAAQLYWRDFNAKPYTVYEYKVTALVTFGGAYRVGTGQNQPVIILRFDHFWVHNAAQLITADMPTFVRLDSWEFDSQVVYSSTIVETWGRRMPVMYYGNINYEKFQLSPLDQVRLNQDNYNRVMALFEEQRNSQGTVCLRMGRDKRRYFGQIINPSYNARNPRTYQHRIEFIETYWDEAVVS